MPSVNWKKTIVAANTMERVKAQPPSCLYSSTSLEISWGRQMAKLYAAAAAASAGCYFPQRCCHRRRCHAPTSFFRSRYRRHGHYWSQHSPSGARHPWRDGSTATAPAPSHPATWPLSWSSCAKARSSRHRLRTPPLSPLDPVQRGVVAYREKVVPNAILRRTSNRPDALVMECR